MLISQEFRASKAFTVFVVCVSIFSEILLLNIVVPILPFILRDRLNLNEAGVQKWSSILLAAHGFGLIVGSRRFWKCSNHSMTDLLAKLQAPFVALYFMSISKPAVEDLKLTIFRI